MKACAHCKLKYPNDSSVCFLCGGELESIQDPLIGTTVGGRYVLGEVIGEGGMATVYAAQHRLVDRRCAIKVMSASFARNEVVRERFRREAKAAQKLAHPNIIEIFDQGEMADGCLYLVMELLQGETVAELVARGPISTERTIHIAVQIARGLARAHDLEVIHRDLKPENLFLASADQDSELVKILDFGIARSMQDARLTGAGEIFGTPQYMAPERITSIDAGPSADLYALGVILYEMLAGQLPFEAPDVATFFSKHMREVPAPLRTRAPGVPLQLEKLVMELLEKEPKARPVDAHRVHSDLLGIASALQIRLPREVGGGEEASRGPAKTLPPLAIDQWVERTLVFERMLQTAFPGGEPRLRELLSQVSGLVRQIGELRARAVEEQRTLETTEAKGRDLRQRFGHAVDALGVDASKARDELKLAVTRCEHLKQQAEQPRERLKSTLPEILLWEGRSGFQAPYPELGQAYRDAANHADEWLTLQRQVSHGEAELTRFRSEVDDLEFQIKELRAALAKHEEQLETAEEHCRRRVGEQGRRADELEKSLVGLATEFCAPLRNVPALQPLFLELESGAAA